MTAAHPFLWFSRDVAPTAVETYLDLVPNSKLVAQQTFEGDEPEHAADIWQLELAGNLVHVMGAAHNEQFTTALSMMLTVADQAELDRVWDGFLSRGGTEVQCGWITDPYGVSWQVIPEAYVEATQGDDPARAQRVVESIWSMVRIDVAAVERAAAG